MRILVTGATGFVGGATCRWLRAAGHDVVGTGRTLSLGRTLERDGIPFLPADLSDPGAAEQVLVGRSDAVVHCAALSSPWGPESDFVSANVTATERLLAACKTRGVSRLVFLSTPSIYMGQGDREGVREDDPLPPPINDYAATKLRAERLVSAANGDRLATISLRPRAIFGPGDTTIFPRLIRALSSGPLPVFGGGQNLVDLTYIDNVQSAIELALVAPTSALGRAYNITNGEPVYLWQLIRRLCGELGLAPPRGRVPRAAGMLLGELLERAQRLLRPQQEPRLTRYTVEVLSATMTLDISLARRELGYTPLVNMDQGVTRFVHWWLDTHGRPRDQTPGRQ
jgi:nucleoside-diphosphate-sugar epimerase